MFYAIANTCTVFITSSKEMLPSLPFVLITKEWLSNCKNSGSTIVTMHMIALHWDYSRTCHSSSVPFSHFLIWPCFFCLCAKIKAHCEIGTWTHDYYKTSDQLTNYIFWERWWFYQTPTQTPTLTLMPTMPALFLSNLSKVCLNL